jgi:hypothetical protein
MKKTSYGKIKIGHPSYLSGPRNYFNKQHLALLAIKAKMLLLGL